MRGKIKKEFQIETSFITSEGEKEKPVDEHWYVYTSNHIYEKIYNKKISKEAKYPWKRKVIKITSISTGCSIYRIWHGIFLYRSKDLLYIDKTGKYLLIPNKETTTVELVLGKGSKLMFYWNHTDAIVRCSYKLGFVSVILGTLSIIITLVALL
nr:hypothetical protein [uncultured Sphaerochaeta sp.]